MDRYTYEIEATHDGTVSVQVLSPNGTVIHWAETLSEALAIVFKMNKKRGQEANNG